MGFLEGKRALITGLISNKSMAYGIAKAMQREGATLAFSYQNERFKARIEKLAADFDCRLCIPCDVSSDDEIEQLFTELNKHWDNLDIIVHSIAFAPADQLQGNYLDNLNREGFNLAHDISSYSFAALAKAGRSMMNPGGAMITISYLGANRVVPNYNLMGVAKASLEANVRYMAYDLGRDKIRVNAVSAGPIKTLAASGIKNFRKMLKTAKHAPLGELTTTHQVGNVAAFLSSPLADGITGDVIYVDGGLHTLAIVDGHDDDEETTS